MPVLHGLFRLAYSVWRADDISRVVRYINDHFSLNPIFIKKKSFFFFLRIINQQKAIELIGRKAMLTRIVISKIG